MQIAINNNLLSEFIPTPNQCDWKKIAKDFWMEFSKLPRDTRRQTRSDRVPAKSGPLYFNYKNVA